MAELFKNNNNNNNKPTLSAEEGEDNLFLKAFSSK